MRTRSASAGLALALALLASAGCGSSETTSTTVIRSDGTTPAETVPSTDAGPTSDSEVPAELAGTSWLIDSYLTVGGLQPFPSDTGAGLSFTDDGVIEVETGCNTGSAEVTFDDEDGTMLVGPLTMTERACTDQEIAAVERALVASLAEPLTWSAHDGTLALTPYHISDTGLRFKAA